MSRLHMPRAQYSVTGPPFCPFVPVWPTLVVPYSPWLSPSSSLVTLACGSPPLARPIHEPDCAGIDVPGPDGRHKNTARSSPMRSPSVEPPVAIEYSRSILSATELSIIEPEYCRTSRLPTSQGSSSDLSDEHSVRPRGALPARFPPPRSNRCRRGRRRMCCRGSRRTGTRRPAPHQHRRGEFSTDDVLHDRGLISYSGTAVGGARYGNSWEAGAVA
jgi:hypothetical protein